MYKYSQEHLNFIKKNKRNKRFIICSRIFICIFIFLLWELLSRLNLINTFLYSSPWLIIKTLFTLIQNNSIYSHLIITIYEIIISFIISSLIGIIIASILWSNKTIYKIIDPFLTILNSLPKVALGPLIIIWVGASTKSIIFMSLLISSFVTILNIYNGFSSVDEKFILMFKSFNANKFQIFTKLIFPINYSNIVSSLKINISMNLIGVIMGELLVSKKGIGYLIMYGSQVFNINLVITGVFILGIISYLMYYLLCLIKCKKE